MVFGKKSSGMSHPLLWLKEDDVRGPKQHAKKVVSNSPRLVDFAIWLVIFVLNKCFFSGNSNYRRIVINSVNQKGCWG